MIGSACWLGKLATVSIQNKFPNEYANPKYQLKITELFYMLHGELLNRYLDWSRKDYIDNLDLINQLF